VVYRLSKAIKIGEFSGEIVGEKYNPLIKRREVTIKITHIGNSTPSRGLVRTEVSKIYGVDINNVYVVKIETEYGIGVTTAYIHIYDSVERAKMFEPEYIIKRNETAMQAYELEQLMKKQSSGEGG